jgi:hypothetical protein
MWLMLFAGECSVKGSWISMISSKDRRFGTGTSDFNTFHEILSGAMPFSCERRRGKRPRGVDGASGVNGRREKKEGACSLRERESEAPTPKHTVGFYVCSA